MELTPEEKKALMDEFIKEAKAEFQKEAKPDIEKIDKLVADLRKANDTALEGKMNQADFKTHEEKILAAEQKAQDRLDEVETKMNRLPIDAANQEKKLPEGATEYKAAFFDFMRSGTMVMDDKVSKYDMERKALVSDTTGQILIPEELESEIYRELPAINIMRTLATIRTITRDRIRRRSLTEVEMGWGKLETGKAAVETDVAPSEDWQYVEDLEGLAKIGKDELADTDISLEAIILDSFTRAKGDKEEAAFVAGTGHTNQQPEGILMGSTVTRVLTVAKDAIATDDIIDLIYEVPAQYRRNGSLLFPSTTIKALRKLKDAVSGQYMWQPSLQLGQPPSFSGYPVYAQENIPAIKSATSCDIGIFGDIKAGYRIVDRAGMTVQRLIELYAQAGLIGILVSSRVTGGVIRPDALRVLREKAS